ncbi:hypothetical protein Rxyl_1136 [Rubrobacter xylanophilus DSM 9941]|uniref:Uncharacterized protein n=1 Tax=Rubrobacter xylanophilus (strain DSM 9941 / JCM 11954 / NBRC 16129 / PRD-1) TaxID=266117 RepID=Q1AWX6_RUBXD|nr:hypothetical protein [Rubrobacter xylanophilus]ABG04102.1 hypothetical protein Rxyl_1136 [Rubrobacter xylanophilus DSM 9941]
MRAIPRTATKAPRGRRGSGVAALAAAGAALLLVFLAAALEARSFEPGASLPDPAVAGVSVSERAAAHPPGGRERFPDPPRALYVYVAVRGLPAGEGLSARVERSGRSSLLGALLGGGGIVVRRDGRPHLAGDGEGVSGVVRFELRGAGGRPLPAGNYTVSVFREGGDRPSAVRRFVVGRP